MNFITFVKAAIKIAAFSIGIVCNAQNSYTEFENLFMKDVRTMSANELKLHLNKLNDFSLYPLVNYPKVSARFFALGEEKKAFDYLKLAIEIGYTRKEWEGRYEIDSTLIDTINNFWSSFTRKQTLKYDTLYYFKLKELYSEDQNDRSLLDVGDSTQLRKLESRDYERISALLNKVFPNIGFPIEQVHGYGSAHSATLIILHSHYLLSSSEFELLKMYLMDSVKKYYLPIGFYCMIVDSYNWRKNNISLYGSNLAHRLGDPYLKYVQQNIIEINNNRLSIGYNKLK
jgi:hypothetical protein